MPLQGQPQLEYGNSGTHESLTPSMSPKVVFGKDETKVVHTIANSQTTSILEKDAGDTSQEGSLHEIPQIENDDNMIQQPVIMSSNIYTMDNVIVPNRESGQDSMDLMPQMLDSVNLICAVPSNVGMVDQATSPAFKNLTQDSN